MYVCTGRLCMAVIMTNCRSEENHFSRKVSQEPQPTIGMQKPVGSYEFVVDDVASSEFIVDDVGSYEFIVDDKKAA
jgi:hypothetical protein